MQKMKNKGDNSQLYKTIVNNDYLYTLVCLKIYLACYHNMLLFHAEQGRIQHDISRQR